MLIFFKKLQKLWNYGDGRTAIASICAHSVSISIGITQGYSAILIPQMLSSSAIPIDVEQASWVASFGAVTNPIGSILSGILAEWIGRKRSMQISCIPFILGWIIIGSAVDIHWLYVGRLITGIAGGMSTACYTYVSEISRPAQRGIMQALGPICASLGILLTYSLGYVLEWHVIAYGSILFSLFTLVSVQLVPESPAWLLTKDKKDESLESLLWFRRNINAVQQEYGDLVNSRTPKADTSEGLDDAVPEDAMKKYFSQRTMKPFLILVVLFLCQEFSGIYTILYYAVIFFKDSNVELDEYVASVVVGVIRFVMSIFAAFLIRRFGRRHLCLLSSVGMAVAMMSTASYIKYYEGHPEEDRVMPMLPLVFVLFNVIFSMVGMLPIPWIMVGELFPLEVRGIMCGLVICIAQFMVFACVKIHPSVVEHLNFSGALYIFAGTSLMTVFFTWFVLPETKDKSLMEIESFFKKKTPATIGNDNLAFVLDLEGTNKATAKDNSQPVTEAHA